MMFEDRAGLLYAHMYPSWQCLRLVLCVLAVVLASPRSEHFSDELGVGFAEACITTLVTVN